MDNEELIKECERRYPKGTKFIPAHVDGKDFEYCISHGKFKIFDGDIYAISSTPEIYDGMWCKSNSIDNGNTSLNRYVFYDKKWAKKVGTIGELEKPKINTYSLKVGDKLPVDVINQWIKIENNYYSNSSEKWIKDGGGDFIGDRCIESFKIIDGVVGFLVSGTHHIYLRAEGFKEFMEEFNRPIFEVGKWYKFTDKYKISQCGKFKEFHAEGYITMSPWIINSTSYNNEGTFLISELSEIEEISPEIIQEFLPDDHPDKLECVNEFTDYLFEPGSYYVGYWKEGSFTKRVIFKPTTNILKDPCYLIDSADEYEYSKTGCCNSEDTYFRPANKEEINWLNKCIKQGKTVPYKEISVSPEPQCFIDSFSEYDKGMIKEDHSYPTIFATPAPPEFYITGIDPISKQPLYNTNDGEKAIKPNKYRVDLSVKADSKIKTNFKF